MVWSLMLRLNVFRLNFVFVAGSDGALEYKGLLKWNNKNDTATAKLGSQSVMRVLLLQRQKNVKCVGVFVG